MYKDTNFTGQLVFNQLLKLITRQTVEQLSKIHPAASVYQEIRRLHTPRYYAFRGVQSL